MDRGFTSIIVGCFTICLLMASCFFFGASFEYKTLKSPVVFFIERGKSSRDIADSLYAHKLIGSPDMFILWNKLRGHHIKAGEYVFRDKVSPDSISYALNKGSTFYRSIQFIEGSTIKSVVDSINKNEFLSGDLTISLKEGDIIPDTYSFSRGDSRNDLAQRLKNARETFLNSYKQLPDHLTDVQDLIVLASIVEKEAGKISEMPRIAAVFLNRLKIKMPLQSDPTVLYGIGISGREPTKDELKIDHNYNTYTRCGLPSGPICNPSKNAILAVLNPEKTTELYFVADGNGGHYFSSSLHEHAEKHNIWRKIREQVNNNVVR
jgi:UPF0755 protein